MKVVAVVGIDGSGKSALAKELSREGELLHIPGYSGVGSRTTHFLGKLYAYIASLGHRLKLHPLVSAAYKLTALLYNEFMKYHRGRDGVVFVERHPFIDAVVYGKEYDEVDEDPGEGFRYVYSKIPEVPDLVVYVDPPSTDEAYRRLVERGEPLELHESPEKLAHARDMYRCVLNYLESQGVPVIRIVSDRPPRELAEEVFNSGVYRSVLS